MALNKPFIESCRNNDVEEVREYLNEVNVDIFVLFSGLAIAAHENHLELLELLLSQPSIDVNLGYMTTEWAIYSTPLMEACRQGHNEVVRRLLQVLGINILHQGILGCTALHLAATDGHSECLKELSKVPGLDWNCKDSYGQTPLGYALYYGYPDCVRIIVSQPGVDFSVKNEIGFTLTEAAVRCTRGGGVALECVKILAAVEDVDWNVKMDNVVTPLVYCLTDPSLEPEFKCEMLDVLAECPRVDLNLQDEAGDSPIVWCLKNRRMNEFRVLRRNPRVELSSAITWAVKNKKHFRVWQLRKALEYRLANAERRLKMSWRGRGDPGAGRLMVDEMTVIKLRSQMNICRGFVD